MGLERGPLSLVSTTEELLDRKVAAPVYKTENMAVGTVTLTTWHTLSANKLAYTSPTSGGRSVSIVRSRTQTMEFFFYYYTELFVVTATIHVFHVISPLYPLSLLILPVHLSMSVNQDTEGGEIILTRCQEFSSEAF
jgi:hypothetical protein